MNELILWIVIGAVTLVLDIITSSLLFVWFTVGSVGAIITFILGYPLLNQSIVFLVISGILLIAAYPVFKIKIKGKIKPVLRTEQTYIGREIIVNDEIIDKGLVKIDGIYWTIRNDGEALKKGDRVKVVSLEGNKFIVKKI